MFLSNLLLAAAFVLFPVSALPSAPSSNVVSVPITRITPLGIATGVTDQDRAFRFAVKYASAARWGPSTVATTWNFPTGATNASGLPLTCPQNGADPSTYTEDCLSMILYVPPTLTSSSRAPTLVWIHGGSFIIGSATDPGLDGSKLAIATNSVVAVIQYRLGALGYMAPNGQTNLALKDTVNALKFLQTVLPSFGGDPSKITLAGQSSGANAIRALLAVPSASALFRSAILQSDPIDYGFLKKTTQATLLSFFSDELNCGANSACLNALPLSTILDAENDLVNNAFFLDASATLSEPIRPVFDGSFITTSLDSTTPFPAVKKPIMVTTVLNEAGFTIYGQDQEPVSSANFSDACEFTFGEERAAVILSSPHYALSPPLNGVVDSRPQLQTLGTDYIWRCSGWTFSRTWVQHGGTAYVGQYVVGSTYPGNDQVSYCTQPGVVCHQDDIMIVFGTAPNPTPAQSALIAEMQKRYKAFLATGNPNTAGVPTWTAAGTSDVHPLVLGGSGSVAVGACEPSFWGEAVAYDYQFFDE